MITEVIDSDRDDHRLTRLQCAGEREGDQWPLRQEKVTERGREEERHREVAL